MTDSDSAWSIPETEVLDSVNDLLRDDREAVLATIIDVEGNAYRRPGAKMVITPDGTGVGSITAGCLEDEVIQIALDVLGTGQPRVETYDLMEDDDVWGLGIGCNGIIDVLLEPLDESYRPVIDAYERGDDIAVVTTLSSDHKTISEGQRTYFRPGDGFLDDEFPFQSTNDLTDAASDLVDRSRGATVNLTYEGRSVKVFVDGVAAPPELVVIGTGHDVSPVVELAAKNGFRTTTIGFRGANASKERFPQADAVLSTSPANLREAVDVGKSTYVVVMTHNFVDDRLAIAELLETPTPYIGMMGPRDRFEEMLDAFEEEGRSFDEDELDRLYTPIGLDLGGGSPNQIAHSIIAEVLAVHNDRTPRHLKERAGPIHDRITVSPAGK